MRCSSLIRSVVASLPLLALAACGSVSKVGPDAGEGDFSLSVSPETLSLPFHESDTVTVTVDRDGSVGDISLSADLPAGIAVDFAPNPIPSGQSSAEATVTVEPGAAVGATTLTIEGSAGGIERSASLALTVETMTVAGRVKGDRSGITVVLVGRSPVTSGGDGSFRFEDVTPPYDLYTVAFAGTASTVPTAFYYEGLTRPDPVVEAAFVSAVAACLISQGTITGTLSGTGDASSPLVLSWSTGGTATTVLEDRSYKFTATWCASASISGTLRGLQWTTKPSGAPDAYLGFGERDGSVSSGGSSNLPLTMSAPAAVSLTGSLSSPSGFNAPAITLLQRLGPRSHVLWTAATEAIDTAVPVLEAGTATLHALVEGGGRATRYVHRDFTADTDVSFALPEPPLQTAPANDATGVDHATAFAWTAPSNGVSSIQFSIAANPGGPNDAVGYRVITTAAQATIPEIPQIPLPGNRSATWTVSSFGPLAGVDAAATEDGLLGVTSSPAAAAAGPPRFEAVGTSRSFTTAP